MRRLAQASTFVHPTPSIICATLAAVIALVAGASSLTAALLAIAMLGFQLSIGALNDLVDADHDLAAHRPNPVSLGLVPRGVARLTAVVGGAVGLTLSATFGPATLAIGAAGYACGVAYDLVMRRRALGWLCFIPAFALLPAWSWMAVTGGLPPDYAVLVLLAAVAGPALHLVNSLVDVETGPALAGWASPEPAARQRRRGVVLPALLLAFVYGTAWAYLLTRAQPSAIVVAGSLAASAIAVAGLSGSASGQRTRRELGWLAQAVAISVLAVAWLLSVA